MIPLCVLTRKFYTFLKALPYVEDKGRLSRHERRNLILLADELAKRGFSGLCREVDTYLQ